MVKIQKISEIEPRLGFTEFDMLKKYRQSFATSELGRLHALFPFSELARQMHLKSSALGRKSYFSPEGKIALMVLKSYTNFSDAQLIEHLNGNIHYQLFCGVQIDPLHPLTNPKIVSAIRQELAHRLDVRRNIFMERIKSFTINHNILKPGFYISRKDGEIVTYDLRTRKPNAGFYLVVRDVEPGKVFEITKEVLKQILEYDGPVFGASAIECGHYENLSLDEAKKECRAYLKVLESQTNMEFTYPQ